MYSEIHPIQFAGGIHNGTLDGLRHFGPHGLRIGGYDPSDYNAWDDVMNEHRDPEGQVEIGVEHPDPQTARDLAQIAKWTIWSGRNLWPGKVPPPEMFNNLANRLRVHEGVPEEPAAPVESPQNAAVSGDMSVTAKWKVVALGELQQPGGVGAADEYNPVVDGPNPNGPSFDDNAANSPEQEVALETWVNMAVDMLNRGEDEQAILARLAHDGCPDPQQVLQRAQQQPENAPVSDEIGQDPFEIPPQTDPSQNGEMQSTSQQPPVMAKRVRIAGTTMTGTEVSRWEGLWGEGQVKVALDDGGSVTVAPGAVEELAGDFKHPVSEIQSFIDSIPRVEPTRPHIEARLANLELVRRAVRANISKVGFSDQVKLQKMDSDAATEQSLLKEVLGNFHEDFEIAYAKAARRFSYNAFEIAKPGVVEWEGNPREAGAIWAVENFDVAVADESSFTAAAAHYASNLGLTGTQFAAFLDGAKEHQLKAEPQAKTASAEEDHDGPAEALFIR